MNYLNENIEVPKKLTDDYFKLYSLLEKEIADTMINIQIDKIFLEPIDVLILAQFIIRQKHRSCAISVSANQDILNYLKAINIVNFCKFNYREPTTIKAIGYR